MEEKRLYYAPFMVTFQFLSMVGVFCFIVFCAYESILHRGGYLIPIGELLLFSSYLLHSTKGFVNLLRGKPALILNSELMIDDFMGTQIKWSDVDDLNLTYVKSISYLYIEMRNAWGVYKQLIDPIFMLCMLLTNIMATFSFTSFTVELSLIKGKNADIFKEIDEYRKSLRHTMQPGI